MMKKVFKTLFWVALAGFIVIQFVPVDRTNPPVTGEISASDPVVEVLRTACYDCHSNETRWPWYSKVAPVSWRIAQHVRGGRWNLNFSEWNDMDPEDQDHAREEIWEVVEKGAMPLSDYLRMHPEAVLTDSQLSTLRRWSEGQAPEFPDWN
jgi:hypothetical protein